MAHYLRKCQVIGMAWSLLALYLSDLASCQPQTPKQLPLTGDNGDMGGIFGIGLNIIRSGVSPSVLTGLAYRGPEYPSGAELLAETRNGSGPYPAHWREDASLPGQTIYAPTSAPANLKLPVVVWGNGGCINRGLAFSNLLVEIASHGYLVVANGPAGGLAWPLASVSQQKRSLDWVLAGKAARYGAIDVEKIAAAGQSCGGLEAYSTSYHEPRVKLTMIFNVGVFDDTRRYLIKELTRPIAWFVGGAGDPGTQFAMRDYDLLRPDIPALMASLDTGHQGTYAATNGGAVGKAAVAFLEWQFRGDASAKEIFADPSMANGLTANRWNVTYRNY